MIKYLYVLFLVGLLTAGCSTARQEKPLTAQQLAKLQAHQQLAKLYGQYKAKLTTRKDSAKIEAVPVKVNWDYDFKSQSTEFGPVIDADSIYLVANSTLNCISKDGTLKWRYYNVDKWPVIAPDNAVITAFDKTLLSINKEGQLKWKFKLPAGLLYDGIDVSCTNNIFFNTESTLYCLNAEGAQEWAFESDVTLSGCAVDKQMNIYVAQSGFYRDGEGPSKLVNRVLCLDANRKQQWQVNLDNTPGSGVFCLGIGVWPGGETVIYAMCNNQTFYVLDLNGVVKWSFSTEYSPLFPVMSDAGVLSVLDPFGQEFFQLDTNGKTIAAYNKENFGYHISQDINTNFSQDEYVSGVFCKDGTFIHYISDRLLGLNAQQELQWYFDDFEGDLGVPAVDKGGVVYVNDYNKLYSLQVPGKPALAETQWIIKIPEKDTKHVAFLQDGSIIFDHGFSVLPGAWKREGYWMSFTVNKSIEYRGICYGGVLYGTYKDVQGKTGEWTGRPKPSEEAVLSETDIEQILKRYLKADEEEKISIEITARHNEALKEAIYQAIAENRHSGARDIRVAFVVSCVRMQAFSDEQKAAVRELLDDPAWQVQNQAIYYAYWAKDVKAFGRVYNMVNNPFNAPSALKALSIMGGNHTAEMLPLLQAKLQNKNYNIRRIALGCALSLKDCMRDETIQKLIREMALNDPYKVKSGMEEEYPLRERAAVGLLEYIIQEEGEEWFQRKELVTEKAKSLP